MVTGGLLWASLPPIGWWPAGVIGVVLLGCIPAATVRARALLGGVAGLVLFGAALRWLWPFTGVGVAVLVALQAGFLATASAVSPAGRGRLVALPGALVLVEALRHRWPLSGLPMAGLELGQVEGPLANVAPYLGPLGVVLAVGGIAAVATRILRDGGVGRVRSAVLLIVLVGLIAVVPAAPGTTSLDRVDAIVVQGGGPRGVVSVGSDPAVPYRRHLAATRELDAGGADLVVWPEDVVDVDGRFTGSTQAVTLSRIARDLSTVLVVGVVEDADARAGSVRRFRNAAIAIGPDGSIVDRYDKQIRVPFGEYVPWRSVVDRFADLSLIPREAVAGVGPPVLDTPAGRLGTVISFEGLFARRVRAAARAGGELLVVPTNSSSYATVDAPAQQVAAARLRALEAGRDLVLASPTGYSAVVTADGTVVARSPLGDMAVLRELVTRRGGDTPYVRFGDLPVVLVAVGLVGIGWRGSTRPAGAAPCGGIDRAARRRDCHGGVEERSAVSEASAQQPEGGCDQRDGDRSEEEPRWPRGGARGSRALIVELLSVCRCRRIGRDGCR